MKTHITAAVLAFGLLPLSSLAPHTPFTASPAMATTVAKAKLALKGASRALGNTRKAAKAVARGARKVEKFAGNKGRLGREVASGARKVQHGARKVHRLARKGQRGIKQAQHAVRNTQRAVGRTFMKHCHGNCAKAVRLGHRGYRQVKRAERTARKACNYVGRTTKTAFGANLAPGGCILVER